MNRRNRIVTWISALAIMVALTAGGAAAENQKTRWQGTSVKIYTPGTAAWVDDLTYAANWWNGITEKGPDFSVMTGVSVCGYLSGSIVACNGYGYAGDPGRSYTETGTCPPGATMCMAVMYLSTQMNAAQPVPNNSATWIAAHELGHAMGLGHANQGIMSQNWGQWYISNGTWTELRQLGYVN